MLVRECIERIRFATSTLDDLSGKAINTLFNNNNIVQQLMFGLDRYAAETQALEGFYSKCLDTNEHTIDAPPLALRAKTYRFIMVWVQGIKYMLDVVNLNPAEAAFQYQWKGVPRWIVAWQNKLIVYPTDVSSFQTTTLTKAITSESTTIEVDDASNFLQFSGFIQIGDEKIGYLSMSDNVFYGCERGVQDTTAVSHSIGSEVKENNFWVYYYKRHFRIPVINNVISQKTLDMEMEVCDEHMEIITSYTASVLLAKIDPIRTAVYDKTFAEALVMAKAQVRRGRKMINPNGDIRNPIFFETNNPGIYLT